MEPGRHHEQVRARHAVGQGGRLRGGLEQVPVHRVTVVRVVLQTAPHRLPLREHAHEQPELVEGLEGRDRRWAGQQQLHQRAPCRIRSGECDPRASESGHTELAPRASGLRGSCPRCDRTPPRCWRSLPAGLEGEEFPRRGTSRRARRGPAPGRRPRRGRTEPCASRASGGHDTAATDHGP